jgi:acetoin utilization deacetylase AcuC-like enzyme
VHDVTYLTELDNALPTVIASRPQCVFYLAGADPYEDDQLGGLRLTREGLRQRDRMVIAAARASEVPLVIVLAGGYARRVEDTVAIHVATIEEAVTASTETRTHENG